MIQYILTDIEGTTTSVRFVYDTLFPYFSDNLADFVAQNSDNAILSAQIERVKAWAFDETQQLLDTQGVVDLLLEWTRQDIKNALLKDIQGLVWAQGYAEGTLKGHVYEEVPHALKNWQAKGLKMGVYSSGSVEAQLLIFGKSIYGDLNPYFSHNFDTRIGHKREVTSYQNIAKEIDLSPEQVLFLSDVVAELDAAHKAGMAVVHVVRPNTIATDKYPVVSQLTDVQVETTHSDL